MYKRAWFWLLVLILVALTVYLRGYFLWQGEQGKYDIRNAVSQGYWDYLQRQSASLEKQYREDTYGGATPEETLKLFVQALEDKDYVLASKYFIPEKQNEELSSFPEAEKSGGLAAFVNAYRNGKVVSPKSVGSSGVYEFEVYETGSTIPFRPRLIENKFTSKWKIEKL